MCAMSRVRTVPLETEDFVHPAYTQWHRKKTRCSGHQPCVRCQQNGQPCQYMPIVSTQAGEDNWQAKSPLTSAASAGTSESRAGFISQEREMNHIRHLPEGSMTKNDAPDDSLQEDQNGHVHGGASEFAFLQLAKQRLACLPAVSIDFSDHPLPSSRNFPPIMPPESVAHHLISTYFDFGLSTSRFVHQPSLIGVVDKMYQGEECERDELALAYMVLALGSHYSKQRSVFCGYTAR